MKNLIISYLVLIGISIAVIIGCTIAGIDIFKDNTGDTSHEHSYGEWKIVEEASCTKTGLKESFCECGDKKSEEIALADHNYVSAVTDPTCTDNGYTTHTCSVCGDTYTDAETESTGHNYGSEVTAPTCTDNGYTTHTCSVCGDTYTDAETESIGHNYGSEVTDPTCTDNGYTTHTCSVCGDTYTEAIESKGHSYDSEVTDPTCTDNGYTTHTCSVCGYSYTDSEVASSGHVAGESKVVTAPTCTEGGYTTYSCEVCGESYIDDETDPVHLYTQWTITESGDTTDTYMKSCDCGQNTAIVSNAPKGSDGLAMEYSEELGGYVVIGRGTCADAHLVIPACYKGPDDENPLPVVAIGEGAFANDMVLESITLIGNVRSIGAQAFVMTMLCHTLVLSDSVREIEEQAFTLMGINLGGTAIYYAGTEKQLQELDIEGHFEFNEVVYITSIEYNYVFGE